MRTSAPSLWEMCDIKRVTMSAYGVRFISGQSQRNCRSTSKMREPSIALLFLSTSLQASRRGALLRSLRRLCSRD